MTYTDGEHWSFSRTFAVKVTRDGSVAGGKCGVKGELLKMYLYAADGDELVGKGNTDTGE